MEYKLAQDFCEEDVIQLILKNIRIVGFGIIGCSECPFSFPHLNEWGAGDINFADPDEGHYNCGLIDKQKIWGENPECADGDWQNWLKYILASD